MKSVIGRDSMVFDPPGLGCVLYLPGLPGSGNKIYDRSPYGNIGTVTGAVWKVTPGGVLYLSFDGIDDYAVVDNAPSLQISGDLTLKAWARSSNYTIRNTVFHKSLYGEYNLQLHPTGDPKGEVYFGHGDGGQFEVPIDVAGILPAVNNWFHIVLVRDSCIRKCYLYINGILKSTSAVYSLTPVATANHIYLGRYSSYYGLIDIALAEIHRRAWQELEVQNRFTGEKRLFGVW
jgi:hypothetical protein